MIRIALVEDEVKVQEQLAKYIHRYAKENNERFDITIFSDGDEIASDYKANYDIILLDVQMPRLDGMSAAELIRTMDKEVILIFITNMANFAIRGYAVDAMDFVLKPVPYFAFSQELNKAIARLRMREKSYVVLPIEGGFVRLCVSDIHYVESYGHRLMIHTSMGEYSVADTMKNMGQQLAQHNFFRCHNSYLVNMEYVERVNHNIVTVFGVDLQISRPKRKAFMAALADYIGGVAK